MTEEITARLLGRLFERREDYVLASKVYFPMGPGPGVTAPIIGATRLGHISDALAATRLTLTDEEARRLEEPYLRHPVLGHS